MMYIQFTVTSEEEYQKMLIFKKLEWDNIDFFFLKNDSNLLINYQNRWKLIDCW